MKMEMGFVFFFIRKKWLKIYPYENADHDKGEHDEIERERETA
jgi:hypothetical protein